MATRVSELRTGVAKAGVYTDLDDRMLVLDFQAGDLHAFGEIHRRYAGLARHVCRRILRNPDDAEEATQETMLRVYQGLERFNGRYALQPWVARIATNVSLDVTRARARRPQVGDRSLTDLQEDLGKHEDDTLEAVERLLERERVNRILADLPEHHREALVLREFEGRSHQEIGDRLGVTPARAKALIHRAKGSFRRAWESGKEKERRALGVMLPVFLAHLRMPQALRRLFSPVQEAAGAATASPAAAAASNAAASGVERVTAATVAVLTAATVAVGAVAVHRARDAREEPRPSPAAAVAAPTPESPAPQRTPAAERERKPEHARDPAKGRATGGAPASDASVAPSPTPPPSPSPPPSGGPSPTPPPPPAPPWSLKLDSSAVGLGSLEPGLISSTVEGTAGDDLRFHQVVEALPPDGKSPRVQRFYVEYWGSVEEASGGVDFWVFIDTEDGRYALEAAGNLAAVEDTEDGGVAYSFSGTYYLTDQPEDAPDLLHDGTLTLVLRFWADGTSLYAADLSLVEA